MRIGTRLSLSIATILIVVLGLALLMLGIARQALRGTKRVEIAGIQAVDVSRLHAEVFQQGQVVIRYLIAGDPNLLPHLEEGRGSVLGQLKRLQRFQREEADLFHAADEDEHVLDPAIIDEFAQGYDAVWNQWQTLIIMRQNGQTRDAVAQYQQQSPQAEALLDRLHQYSFQRVLDSDARRIGITAFVVKALQGMYILIAVVVILSLLFSFQVVRLVKPPISHLKKATEALGRGQLDITIPIKRDDEFGELARSIEHMARQLSTSMTSVDRLRHEVQERKQAQLRLARIQQKLRALAAQLTLVEERERRRIAGGLHDNVCQKLVLSKLSLQSLRRRVHEEAVRQTIDHLCQLIDEMITEARSLTFELGNPLLHEVGLDAALSSWLRRNVTQDLGLRSELLCSGPGLKLQEHVRVLLYRAVCELVTNTIKHAQARNVTVSLRHQEGKIVVVVQDDGIGFDVKAYQEEHRNDTGYGLFDVCERVEHLGGTVTVRSNPKQGTVVTLRIPEAVAGRPILDAKPRQRSSPPLNQAPTE